jgi:hypothetical protein
MSITSVTYISSFNYLLFNSSNGRNLPYLSMYRLFYVINMYLAISSGGEKTVHERVESAELFPCHFHNKHAIISYYLFSTLSISIQLIGAIMCNGLNIALRPTYCCCAAEHDHVKKLTVMHTSHFLEMTQFKFIHSLCHFRPTKDLRTLCAMLPGQQGRVHAKE